MNNENVHGEYKIIRGIYLTGFGQEDEVYYFKIHRTHPDFGSLETGKVCLTFYQGSDVITFLPAIIRIDGIINTSTIVQKALNMELQKGYPLLGIIRTIDDFDILKYEQVLNAAQTLKNEIELLAPHRYIQGGLFDEYD